MLWLACLAMAAGCASRGPAGAGVDRTVSGIIGVYQGPLNHLAAVRFGGCPMEPHCSAYATEALERHGLFKGVFMTFDRLIRCGNDEVHLSPEVVVNGRRRVYDPVAANECRPLPFSDRPPEWHILIE